MKNITIKMLGIGAVLILILITISPTFTAVKNYNQNSNNNQPADDCGCPDWGNGLVCDPDMFEGAVTCSEPYKNGKCFECVKCLDKNNEVVGQDCRWICDPISIENSMDQGL